jgi:hypothetical protein
LVRQGFCFQPHTSYIRIPELDRQCLSVGKFKYSLAWKCRIDLRTGSIYFSLSLAELKGQSHEMVVDMSP